MLLPQHFLSFLSFWHRGWNIWMSCSTSVSLPVVDVHLGDRLVSYGIDWCDPRSSLGSTGEKINWGWFPVLKIGNRPWESLSNLKSILLHFASVASFIVRELLFQWAFSCKISNILHFAVFSSFVFVFVFFYFFIFQTNQRYCFKVISFFNISIQIYHHITFVGQCC